MARDQSNAVVVKEQSTDDGSAAEEDPTAITKNDLFHVLQNERRRRVLKYLVRNGDGPFEMRTIAEHVAAVEHGTTVQALTSDQRQRVYIALYQSHLPKLDEKGFIDYNQSRGVVEKRPLVTETAEHLTDVQAEDESEAGDEESLETESTSTSLETTGRWENSFASATVLSVLFVTLAWTNVFDVLSGLELATVVVMLFGTLSLGLLLKNE